MSLYPSSMQHILPRGEKHLARHRGQSYTSLYIINEPYYNCAKLIYYFTSSNINWGLPPPLTLFNLHILTSVQRENTDRYKQYQIMHAYNVSKKE